MGKSLSYLSVCSVLLWNVQASEAVTVKPLKVNEGNEISLGDYKGKKTFFEVMTLEEDGIQAKLDALYETAFEIADSDTVLKARSKFTDKVSRNALREFGGTADEREQAMAELVDELRGDADEPNTIKPADLKKNLSKRGMKPWSLADFISMASGAAVLVKIDPNNYYYNVSYEAAEVNSGRSFGAGPSHKADDASYPFYLNNLRAYFSEREDLSGFYAALMGILTQSDPTALGEISDETENVTVDDREVPIDGQTLATDFVTIYTAELYRHINSDLKKHDWENALAELTFVSAFSEKAGLVQNVDGEVVDGTPSNWRYVGTEGSGIGGKQGIERRSFQRKVCKAARSLKIEALKTIDELTGNSADCFQGTMKLLNNYETQTKVRKNAKRLNAAMVEFLSEIRERSNAIAKKVKAD